ncbi:ATP-dependent DNA helicase PcrA [bacterium HR37]|nr:ATP-dependent DNA helicase PcrA [bacterium HR37]
MEDSKIREFMGLNEEQEVVLDLDAQPVVEAGAGSGKTTALVARYLCILEQGRADVDGIVAITFTENAASEMKGRIRSRIKEYIRRYGERSFLRRDAVRKLTGAPIGTIHGFAARLIRENPLESGVSLDFSVVDEIEKGALVRKAIDDLILELWQSEPDGEGLLKKILKEEGFNFEQIRKKLSEIIYLADTFHIEPPFCVFGGNELKEEVGKEKLIEILIDRINGFPDEYPNKNVEKRMGKVKELASKVLGSPYGSGRVSFISGICKELEGICNLKKADNSDKDLAGELLDLANHILSLFDLELSHLYKELAERAFYLIRERKRQLGVLDYEDLLRFARNLLEDSSERCASYISGFKYVMVDEFQDTDRLQFEIIRLLCKKAGANLFVVGDSKQAIFGFRGGDPSLFSRLKGEGNDFKSFVRNYRSQAPLVGFFNKFFEKHFDRGYEYMCPEIGSNSKIHPIEFIISSGKNVDECRRKEAKSISRRILELRKQGYSFKDMALLLRYRTFMYVYESSLREFNIPYRSVSGGTLFAQTEVRDIVAFIRYLLNPGDRIAEACVLRSPFLGVSDEELLSFYGKRERVERISDFLEFVGGLRKVAFSLTPASLLEFILRETGFDSAVLALRDGLVKYENIGRLLRVFKRLESMGLNVVDILDYLESGFEEDYEPPSQSELLEEDSVKVLTVHKAKGLEFPVVFLADLDHAGGESKRVAVTGKGEFLVRHEGTSSSLWKQVSELKYMEELEEEKRILYVAKTRAKDLLVVAWGKSGKSRPLEKKLSFLIDSVIGVSSEVELNTDRVSFCGFEIPIWREKGVEKAFFEEGKPSGFSTLEGFSLVTGDLHVGEGGRGFVLPIGELSPLEVGKLMHRFLELWDFREESVLSTARFVLAEASCVDCGSITELFSSMARNFLKSELIGRIKRARRVYREVPFLVEDRGYTERGRMDLVLEEERGVSVFDYKYVMERSELASYREQLKRYLHIASKRFKKHTDGFFVILPQVELVPL